MKHWFLSLTQRFLLISVLSLSLLFVVTLTSHTQQAHASSPTWQLMDYTQKACVRPSNPYDQLTTYYGVWLNGTWTHEVNAGISGAPVGSTTWTSYLPIPPGSSDGVGSLGYVALQVPRTTPTSIYTFQLWASDGTTTEQVSVSLLVSATKCVNY